MSGTRFISELTLFKETVLNLLEGETDCEIYISGTFDNSIYKSILDRVIKNATIKSYKVIIPYVTGSGIISRSYINKLSQGGGQVRLNSQFRKNLLIIGNHAFVLSFSSKYNSEYGMRSTFECCMLTDDTTAVKLIRENFMSMWQESLPITNE